MFTKGHQDKLKEDLQKKVAETTKTQTFAARYDRANHFTIQNVSKAASRLKLSFGTNQSHYSCTYSLKHKSTESKHMQVFELLLNCTTNHIVFVN